MDKDEPTNGSCRSGHEWVVFSTALTDHCLLVQCVDCLDWGVVEDPTGEEWSEAFHAPSHPYRWQDAARVRVTGGGKPYVARSPGGKRCDCHARLGRPLPGEYERVPGEIISHSESLTPQERAELEELARFVATSDLCSTFYPLFLKGFEQHSGRRHTRAVHRIARRIEEIDGKGLHFSPGIVALVLREHSRSGGRATPAGV